MSKKTRVISPELPQTEGIPEIPNYVIPTTELAEDWQTAEQAERPEPDCPERCCRPDRR